MVRKLSISERTYRSSHGFGPGTIPSDVKIKKHTEDDYYDYYEFDRDLTKDEISKYDLRDMDAKSYMVSAIKGDLDDIDRYINNTNTKKFDTYDEAKKFFDRVKGQSVRRGYNAVVFAELDQYGDVDNVIDVYEV